MANVTIWLAQLLYIISHQCVWLKVVYKMETFFRFSEVKDFTIMKNSISEKTKRNIFTVTRVKNVKIVEYSLALFIN